MKETQVLVIEDEPDTAKTLSARLRAAGFAPRIAQDAAGGIQAAHAYRPDLIILDLMLPAGGGLKVLKNVKNSVHTNFIPVFILTGKDDAELRKQAIDIGVDAYFLKPYESDKLIAEIKRALGIE
jgi:two-component system phosphate regulon response regulator PhoB